MLRLIPRRQLLTVLGALAAVTGILTPSAVAASTVTSTSTTDKVTTTADIGPVSPSELHVMTFNLRYASTSTPNSWQQRRPVMRELLRAERPALIGTQEGLYQQLRDIQADLPPYYDSIGLGRQGGSRDEAMQIFFDTRRLDPLEYDHYWLSDTPNVIGSQTWGGCCPRMVTWIRFLDKRTGAEFYAVNTHFEAFSADARAKSAALVLSRLPNFDPDLPVVMTGDFNEAAATGQTVYDRLVTNGPLLDTWTEAQTRGPLYATFHGYQPLVPNGPRIDWILTSSQVQTRAAIVNTFNQDGQFPSDHLPVQAILRIPAI
ncbi:endonuclease/exonuclease/phosphatase family protein [Actinopolymorpha alba]|uniref:endonuclease/exonuclease/phosphatase family protein n=1 Tax=Actinopolymorpha alba TaxID=533267 RepID=UPI000368025E|nr:endonuclease/exonuclease/phosphatase family protein [Actinopolymorpha alba]